jgi:hypothetical protein
VQPLLLSISRPFQNLDIWPGVRYKVIAGGKEVRASSVLLLVQVGEGGVLAGEVQLNNPQNRPKAALSVLTLVHGKQLYTLRVSLVAAPRCLCQKQMLPASTGRLNSSNRPHL